MLKNRLPYEIKSSDHMAGRNRLLQQEVVGQIADKISAKIGRPMDQLELQQMINHIKKLNGNDFLRMPIDQATSRVADGYLSLTGQRADVIYDTHEIMKQYIGGGVPVAPDRFIIKKNCGTGSGATPDIDSVAHQGGHINAYAMFPELGGFTGGGAAGSGGMEGVTGRGGPLPQYVAPGVTRPAPLTGRTIEGPDLPMSRDGPKTLNEEDYLLTRLGRDIDLAGVPVQGAYVKKNNVIKPREKSIRVLLDSRYRVRATTPSTFTWSLTSQPSNSPGVASAQSGMGNVIYMQIEKFFIPYVPDADNVYQKVSMLVEELGMTSVMAHENRHYHMMFDTEVVTNRILLTPEHDDKFRFNDPIYVIKRLTVTFAAPLTPLTFLPDFYPITVSSFAPGITYLSFPVEHFVSDGEVVIVSGFTSAAPQVDFTAINAVNNPVGNVVAVIDNFTLSITVDTSTVSFLASPPSVEAYITTRRIFIPVRFVYVV